MYIYYTWWENFEPESRYLYSIRLTSILTCMSCRYCYSPGSCDNIIMCAYEKRVALIIDTIYIQSDWNKIRYENNNWEFEINSENAYFNMRFDHSDILYAVTTWHLNTSPRYIPINMTLLRTYTVVYVVLCFIVSAVAKVVYSTEIYTKKKMKNYTKQ